MGRCRRGGVHIEMSATQSNQDIWKDSRAAVVKRISLWRVLTAEMELQALHVAKKCQVRGVMYRRMVEMSGIGKQRWQ